MRQTISPQDRKVLEDWFDRLARLVADERSTGTNRAETIRDLKVRIGRLEHQKRSLSKRLSKGRKGWNCDDLIEVESKRQIALSDMKLMESLLSRDNSHQTERLWIMSTICARLRKGDRFEAVKKAVGKVLRMVEARALAQRIRRWKNKELHQSRRRYLYNVLVSHFHPPSLTKWMEEHPGENVPMKWLSAKVKRMYLDSHRLKCIPVKVNTGPLVFAGIEERELTLLRRLFQREERDHCNSASTISSATCSASSRVSPSTPVN